MKRAGTALSLMLFMLVFSNFVRAQGEPETPPSPPRADQPAEKPEGEPEEKKKDPPHFEPVPDRWRGIQPPPYEVNEKSKGKLDPYNQNPLKGDMPIIGQNTFLILTLSLQNALELAKSPLPSGVSTLDPGSFDFFGAGERGIALGTLLFSFELYGGQTAFRPRDWEIKITPAANINYVDLRENNAVNINVRKGDTRRDEHLAFQELFFEKHLFDLNDRYDFVSAKVGIQRFGSDFRDFIFSDYNLGLRLFGSAKGNRYQYNLIYFSMLEKDTNSELNTVFDDREQDVLIANLYKQDFGVLGYTAQLSLHYNRDRKSTHFNENGFPVRPAVLGNVRPHEVKAAYLGWAGDGHLGRLNLSHALYFAFGEDDFNSLAGRPVDIEAGMAALELSIDKDWMRFKGSLFYATGDDEPDDGIARGFDTILDRPFFAGGYDSYWNQQPIPLLGVNLVNKNSLVPNLRSSNIEGQANFVNPGLWLFNLGYDAEWTPKLKMAVNLNYLRFDATQPLERFVNQNLIDEEIGLDGSIGFLYRPMLNNNIIFRFAAAALKPGDGFEDLFETRETQGSLLVDLKFTY